MMPMRCAAMIVLSSLLAKRAPLRRGGAGHSESYRDLGPFALGGNELPSMFATRVGRQGRSSPGFRSGSAPRGSSAGGDADGGLSTRARRVGHDAVEVLEADILGGRRPICELAWMNELVPEPGIPPRIELRSQP